MRIDRFVARTVLVQKGQVEEAFRVLNRILASEGVFADYRRTLYFEKPFLARRRINYGKCKAIYNEDMQRRIKFTLRTNRAYAFPGR